MESKEKLSPKLTVNVRNVIGVAENSVLLAKGAIDVVWRNCINVDDVINLDIVGYFVDDSGKHYTHGGNYDPETKTITIAVKSETFQSFLRTGLSEKAAMCLLTAHEMGHRLQDFRGERLIPSNDLTDSEYSNSTQEAEAWEVALHTFKNIWYESTGSVDYLGKKLVIPEESKYKIKYLGK